MYIVFIFFFYILNFNSENSDTTVIERIVGWWEVELMFYGIWDFWTDDFFAILLYLP